MGREHPVSMDTEHFGLTGRPFQLTPDPGFWYESATHRKAMAYLGYGLALGEGFIVITGEIGAGKTTLLAHLLDTLDPSRVEAIQLASTLIRGDDVLKLVAHAMGEDCTTVDRARVLTVIEEQLAARARAGKRILIVVDEVQNMTVGALEELRMVSNFSTGSQPVVQFLLLGQPEFKDTIASAPLEQLKQRVIATHHLGAMEEDEVLPYIEHRLRHVGWAGRPQIDAGAITRLFAESAGIPRRVNQLMTRALLMAALEESDIVSDGLIEAVVADLNREEAAGRRISEAPAPQPAIGCGPTLITDDVALDMAARITMLEAQVAEQEASLRRVLGLLIDWVEGENAARRVSVSAH